MKWNHSLGIAAVLAAMAGLLAGCTNNTLARNSKAIIHRRPRSAQAMHLAQAAMAFRPPAVPLLAVDPYLSVWSEGTRLADHHARAWYHARNNLISIVRVDGHPYRLMGGHPANIPDLRQLGVQVEPTRTIYHFIGAGVRLRLTFMTPRLPSDMNALGLPVTYIKWQVSSADGNPHRVSVFYSTSAQVAVSGRTRRVRWKEVHKGGITAIKVSAYSPTVLQGQRGLQWGSIYTAAQRNQVTQSEVALRHAAVSSFVASGNLPAQALLGKMHRVSKGCPVAAMVMRFGRVAAQPEARWLMVGIDEQWAINYYHQKLRPYWKRHNESAMAMLHGAAGSFAGLRDKCVAFDHRVMADCEKIGGTKYALVAALAYRQALAADGLAADPHGQPYLCTFENTSGGDISTMDVIYPAAPECLLFCPDLMKAMLVPVMNDSYPPHWPFKYAPHDLGSYPNATGHPYHGGENMPVEESGNMELLFDAICQADGNPRFANRYWGRLTKWAHYLGRKGFDPGNQLCTDDFAGLMAHNANLSIKAIEGIAAYGQMCKMKGLQPEAQLYQAMARRWAKRWMKVDRDPSGTHYDLGFGMKGTWSQKYNLIWDRVLHLGLFPRSVVGTEMNYYMKKLQPYGLPLDSRKLYTKTDWSIWSASMARSPAHFHRILNLVYKFLDKTPSRVPLSDFYWTNSGKNAGMFARPVMGAAFMPFLTHHKLWMRWVARGAKVKGDWVKGLPPLPGTRVVVPTARLKPVMWHYTINKPKGNWKATNYKMQGWKKGPAGFGSNDPGVTPRTSWLTDNIWLRRTFTMPRGKYEHLEVHCYHDEDVQIYINGVLAAEAPGFSTSYVWLPMTRKGRAALKPGQKNTLAVHVLQTGGGQFFDMGFGYRLAPKTKKWAIR